jgi:hypothetical protein
LTASASAEFLADIALCPFEAVKVRMQTTIPPFAKGTFDGISTIVAKEGAGGLYKGLYRKYFLKLVVPESGNLCPWTKISTARGISFRLYTILHSAFTDFKIY